MNAEADAVKTGTSTVGITFDGGVVVGADHRATMGHFIANKSVKDCSRFQTMLLLQPQDWLDTSSLSRTLAAELRLYELKRNADDGQRCSYINC